MTADMDALYSGQLDVLTRAVFAEAFLSVNSSVARHKVGWIPCVVRLFVIWSPLTLILFQVTIKTGMAIILYTAGLCHIHFLC